MRIIKLVLIGFFFIFLVFTAISLLIPSHVRISKAANFKNGANVFALIKDESKWQQWHPAYQDSTTRMQWASITRKILADTDSTFIIELQQQDRKAVVNGWELYHYSHGDSITLQWYMDFKLSWRPWEKFSSLFYERNYGTMMEKGLTNLKEKVSYLNN